MNNRIDPFDELAAMFLTAPQPGPPTQPAGGMTPSSPRADSLASAQPMIPAASNTHAVMTELLVVGHLPVRAGLWLVPYADLLAREMGTVGLIRLDAQEPTLQLLRAPEAFATVPLRTPLRQTIFDLAGCVDVWMLRGGDRLSTDDAIDCRPDRITILSSADEAAVVAAYQTIKELAQAAEHPHRTLPAIGMAMVGCDSHAAAAVIDRLNRTTVSFLGVEVKLVALLPRMDAGIKCTRYMTFGNEATPGILDVRNWIDHAKSQSPSPMTSAQPVQPPMPQMPPHSTLPSEPSVIGRITPAPQSHETFVHDARRILRGPSQEFAETPATQPPPAAAIPQRPPAASAPTFSPPRAAPVVPPQNVVTPAEREDLLSAIAPQVPGVGGMGGAKLPPKVVINLEHKPAPSLRPTIEPDESGQPIPLARFVAGLNALPLRPPGHERIELAVDDAGRMHLLAREQSMRELPVVERWARDHRELLAMACPQHRFDPAGSTVCHVFTAEPALLADLHGSELRLHVLAPVTVGDKTAWFAAPLNVVR